MDFVSILDFEQPQDSKGNKPAYFTDLNIGTVIKKISDFWGEDVAELFERSPEGKRGEQFRREVYFDMKRQGVENSLLSFRQRMKNMQRMERIQENVDNKIQISFLHVKIVGIYCEAIEELLKDFSEYDFTSEGMKGFVAYVKNYAQSEKFQAMKAGVEKILEGLKQIRIGVTYERDYLEIFEGTGVGSYEEFLANSFPNHGVCFKSPFMATEQLTELEYEILKIYAKKHKGIFSEVEAFKSLYETFKDENVLRFERDIVYYLAFLKFQHRMEEADFAFCVPEVDENKNMEALGLYDLALACVNIEYERPVVSNDMTYHPEESFFVVTGFNQGGKTTFARSLGQLVYFTKMGFDVPAQSATLPYFKRILTHFSVEESVDTGRGKLMEELTRLAPMMKEEADGAFVVINELFTTAANYDACIMGKKVLMHFIENHCKGVYVTHLHELSKEENGVVSLSAMIDENKHQTFKIKRSPVLSEASAGNQVKKYRLSYEQIKERFS